MCSGLQSLEICGQLLSDIVSTGQCGSKSLDAESALPESMTVNYDEAVRKTVRCFTNSSHSLLRLCRSTSMSMQIQFVFQTLEIRNEKLIESQRVKRFRVFRTLNFRSLNLTELLGWVIAPYTIAISTFQNLPKSPLSQRLCGIMWHNITGIEQSDRISPNLASNSVICQRECSLVESDDSDSMLSECLRRMPTPMTHNERVTESASLAYFNEEGTLFESVLFEFRKLAKFLWNF